MGLLRGSWDLVWGPLGALGFFVGAPVPIVFPCLSFVKQAKLKNPFFSEKGFFNADLRLGVPGLSFGGPWGLIASFVAALGTVWVAHDDVDTIPHCLFYCAFFTSLGCGSGTGCSHAAPAMRGGVCAS